MKNAAIILCAVLSWLAVMPQAARAHSPASSHLEVALSAQQPLLTFDLALVDVAQLVLLDADADNKVSWAELLAAQTVLANKVRAATVLERGQSRCALSQQPAATSLVRYASVPHVSLVFAADCAGDDNAYSLAFDLMFALDPGHRVLVKVQSAAASNLAVLTATDTATQFAADQPLSALAMLGEGFHHILDGYDHLLFLLLLILPLAVAEQSLRQHSLRIAGIITAFTAAHSATLAIATLGIVVLPAGPVEIAIAASIVIAGLLNIFRPGHRIGWRLAFAFGLLHGFGFAGALAELGLAGDSFLLQLLAFNMGVELGQLCVVALALPLLILLGYWMRNRQLLVPVLSAAGAGMGLVWVISRV